MENKTYKVALAPMKPARNSRPFQAIESLTFSRGPQIAVTRPAEPKPEEPRVAKSRLAESRLAESRSEESRSEESARQKPPSRSRPQLSRSRASRPTIRTEPDQRGRVQQRVVIPMPPPVDRRNFFQRFFQRRQSSNPSRSAPLRPDLH